MTTTTLERFAPDTLPERIPNFALSDETLAALRGLVESDRSMYDESLDDIVTQYLVQCVPEFTENISMMRTSRTDDAQREIKSRQLRLIADTRQMIAAIYHLPQQSEFEEAKENIFNQLGTTSGESPLGITALASLGIIKTSKDGSCYRYPYGLFPSEIDTAWGRYLSAAEDHEKYATCLRKGAGEDLQQLVVEKDRLRRDSHNTVATLIRDILDLGSLDDARGLVTQMRDHTIVASDKDTATHRPNHLAPGMTIVRAMHHHLLPDFDSLPDPERYHH